MLLNLLALSSQVFTRQKDYLDKHFFTGTLLSMHRAPGLISIMASGYSYLAAVFNTTSHMLEAIDTLKESRFEVEGEKVDIVVKSFEINGSTRMLLWTATGGYT